MTNDKITYLKQCAGIADNPDQEGLDLFAQLIAEECAMIAQAGTAIAVSTVIKETFGVKTDTTYIDIED
ncbi:hypothetical protein UFOVP181_14 [uncultured Caudovirales phage]|uniref:Uncharacterized protein n=1 Tax=uncultured Caudovirales phage TaxID=2100421 RepID=A0A6J5KVY2_9CAUD|nr:hypothetical protein UFOVP57_149 [uncultured Caudovirales phage]CAB5208410.1 hypothetical protein UFOVP181_14 [uncultured Caudovirales phage]